MTVKQYLRKMRHFHQELQAERRKINELRLLAGSTGAIRYDKDRVVSSLPQEAGFENALAEIQDREAELEKNIAKLIQMHRIGEKLISSLKNPIDQIIMTERYINNQKFADIAVDLQYSAGYIYYRRNEALKELENMRKNEL